MVRFNHKNLLCLQRCNHSQSYLSSISNRPFPVLKDTLDPASPESVKAIGVSKTASEELNLLKNLSGLWLLLHFTFLRAFIASTLVILSWGLY